MDMVVREFATALRRAREEETERLCDVVRVLERFRDGLVELNAEIRGLVRSARLQASEAVAEVEGGGDAVAALEASSSPGAGCQAAVWLSLVAKAGQRQQQAKQQAHDDQHENISFHGDARDARATV
jgi:hypothetical protein